MPIHVEGVGTLRERQVLIEYDGPQLAVWRDQVGGDYLALHLPDELGQERWLLARSSPKRLSHIKAARLDLRSAFADAELGVVHILTLIGPAAATAVQVEPSTLPDDLLPEREQFLTPPDQARQLATSTAVAVEQASMPVELRDPAPLWEISPAAIAYLKSIRTPVQISSAHSGRLVADLILRPSDGRTDVPVTALGAFLTSTQKLVDALALEEDHGRRGPVKAAIKTWTQLDAVASFPSSFALRVESHSGSVDPLTYGKAAFKKLLAMLSAADDREKLLVITSGMSGRAVAHYRAFTKAVMNSEAGFRAVVGFPDEAHASEVQITAEQVARTYRQLEANIATETTTVTLTGRLVALSLKTRFFLIETDNESYSGKVDENALSKVNLSRIGGTFIAKLAESFEVSDVTGEALIRHTLQDLQEVSAR
ncbi:DUF6575 domain-containing protein [Sphingomonas sp. BK345]|uniref:DUF6575 domain-containing protein n=1 Tax=Sphingomonas sp. BK345 TaxID=2586980 RepID=UPI0016214FFF|nr:DUF6575 domain-containing protein [Sphingomonas sp. BK345]MBB3474025.1 hypothetical protein [Sphingomonas sp. BK345]